MHPTGVFLREFIDYKTSMTTHSDPLRGFGGNQGLDFSHALPVVVERRRRCEHPRLLGHGVFLGDIDGDVSLAILHGKFSGLCFMNYGIELRV